MRNTSDPAAMPRKRATRAQTNRGKPKLEASDEDDIVNGMTRAERKAKLENIICDFRLNGTFITVLAAV